MCKTFLATVELSIRKLSTIKHITTDSEGKQCVDIRKHNAFEIRAFSLNTSVFCVVYNHLQFIIIYNTLFSF